MQVLKISLITVTYNAQKTIARCINSVIAQNYGNLEYIIIDGASTDDTLQIIRQYNDIISICISEPDMGIYNAMNKGIKIATGDVVGMLNADDFFADENIMNKLAKTFLAVNPDIIYGNLNYVKPNGRVIRKWQSGEYKHGMFNWGWMPPHPTFYCKRGLFDRLGFYDEGFGTAADYELMLRFIHANKATVFYLNVVMVNMTPGGASNKSYTNRALAWGNDYKAMGKNGVKFPLLGVVLKPLRKLLQFV